MPRIWSEAELDAAECDPMLARRYYQGAAMNSRRLALEYRRKAHQQAVSCSVVGFGEVAAEGFDMLNWASVHDIMADLIFEHLDAMVRSSIRPAQCTCLI